MSVFDFTKPVGLASDHAGFELKKGVMDYLKKHNILFTDFGTYSKESCDYPDYAHPLANAVEEGLCCCGIAICGTGNGISMTLNKHQHIRAALCWDEEIVSLARAHNDANVLALPGRYLLKEDLNEMLDTFFNTPFEGGRHKRRIDKIPVRR